MRRLSSFRGPSHLSLRWPLTIAAIFVAANLFGADEGSAGSISREVKAIFDKSRGAVVKIYAVDPHGELCGTGFFVDPTGTLYTAYSVGGEADSFTVEFKGKKMPARQLVADVRSGLAILKVDSTTPTLPIGKSDEMEVATPVVSIGFPLDLGETANFGMIAGFDRKYLGHYFSTVHLRANLPTQRGEAGAPVLNFKGEVVGVIVMNLENNSSCYAVPIEVAEKIRNDFVRFGEVRHGWIGIDVGEAQEAVADSRVEMTNIVPDTPAADSGVKAGDILLQIGRKPIHQPEDVIDASFFITAGDTVPITVMRGDQKMTFNIQAEDLHPLSRDTILTDGGQGPNITNRAIPLSLRSEPKRSP